MAIEYKPYPYQQRAVDSIFEYYKTHNGNPIIAIPTAGGKAIILSFIIKRLLESAPNIKILVLTHVKELIAQNFEKMKAINPTANAGIVSAGLGVKQPHRQVVFGGIATVKNMINKIGFRDICFVDECHLISPKGETTYQTFFKEMTNLNPNFKIIGLTATPYRLGSGLLTNNGIFTGFSIDLTSFEEFNKLLSQGYLSPLVPRQTHTKFDLSNVHTVAGDYNQKELEEAFNIDAKTLSAVNEIMNLGRDRKKWLIFASGIKHAEKICDCLKSLGISAITIHNGTSKKYRDKGISDFKAGRIKCIVNNSVLTTGFDVPDLDLIAILRATQSTSLWVQILGRGTRIAPNKTDCMVMDFAGNTERLGTINDPKIPKAKTKGNGDQIFKVCPECESFQYPSVRICSFCGYEFPQQLKIEKKSSNKELITTTKSGTHEWHIKSVVYSYVDKTAKHEPSLKVKYNCGIRSFTEFIPFEKEGAKFWAFKWWKARFPIQSYGTFLPKTTQEAFLHAELLIKPYMIKVRVDSKGEKIVGYSFVENLKSQQS